MAFLIPGMPVPMMPQAAMAVAAAGSWLGAWRQFLIHCFLLSVCPLFLSVFFCAFSAPTVHDPYSCASALSAAAAAAAASMSIPAAPDAPPPGELPATDRVYSLKDGARLFLLTEKEMESLPHTKQRNHSGPYPICVYEGSELLKAAFDK